jgi:MoaA/NifB/PqqE/SkfB family radical SAM enzyme
VLKNGRAEVLPNIHSLNRLYVEPTSRCNLACRTCIRNTWEEPAGDMSPEIFDRLAGQLGRFPHLESVMFGGFGEPTAHPAILGMVKAVKALGLRAEMTTNATLLDEALVDGLLRERLDTLWISLDGAGKQAIRPGPVSSASRRVSGPEERRDEYDRDRHRLRVVANPDSYLDRLARSVAPTHPGSAV